VSNEIPTVAREMVKGRDRLKCVRCGMPGSQWHHRRSRSVRDLHQHCPCNGVWLCRICHNWVHANPFMARRSGFIVSRHNPEPGSVPVEDVLRGSILLTCDGEAVDGIPQ
jgi:hypothetical protein